ncbi:MAG: Rid family hydrolase [Verrucomicrobiota bacterium JB024]|nr:Rid family hydrolase [Verrucomicrobiota bacterium JB024]
MEYSQKTIDGVKLEVSQFSKNKVDELHLFAKPCVSGAFSEQITQIVRARKQYLAEIGIPPGSLVFSRYFISDYANQAEALELIQALDPSGSDPCAVSIVQQPPLGANKVEAWSYVIHDQNQQTPQMEALSEHELLVRRGGYRHLWSSRLVSNNGVTDSAGQTANILKAYHRQLEDKGFSLKDDCLRTWLFVKDVDFNYQGVVEARKDFFAELGMTAETHYIASTGIEGRHANPRMNVMLDAYSVGGLAPEQIKFLQARENLNPTHEYGVTFERGTSVDFGDRRHILISGTASIDNRGQILHLNDVRKQTARAIENIIALLDDADASMQDVAHMIVYLRDIADTADVERYIEEHYPHVPKTFVWAPVCRPGWLVEIECMAIKSINTTSFCNF